MELTLPPNPLHLQEQTIIINKVAALIGENGSGKSIILKSIFDSRLAKEKLADKKVICFSSGQNESFSNHFSNYLARERQANRGLDLGCFYFDKPWSKLLIFLASVTINGRVRGFLLDNSYIETDEETKDDISSVLRINVKVSQAYVNRVERARRDELAGETETLLNGAYHQTLQNFINEVVAEDYDFEEPMEKKNVRLSAQEVISVSYEVEGSPVNPLVSFYTQAADNNYFIEKDSLELTFSNGLNLDDLSDGEYQLLFLYALFDLLDDKSAVFLLDEADSHLHYKNIEILWEHIHNVQGIVLTTTHLIDSITAKNNTLETIKVVQRGEINEELKVKQIVDRLKVISRIEESELTICSRIPKIVIMDDYNDWIIFRTLAARKGHDTSILDCCQVVKKSLGYDKSNQNFAQAKFDWLKKIASLGKEVKNDVFFLICDRDNASLGFKENGVSVTGYDNVIASIQWKTSKHPPKVHLLSWQRREIKNYLLSYTALSKSGHLDYVNSDDKLASAYRLIEGDPGDNEGIRRLEVKSYITEIIDLPDLGLSAEKLQDYVATMPPTEISSDITNMYTFLAGEL